MLIDHHCHLDFPQFAEDRDGLIARAHAAGVGLMVTISTRVAQFEQVKAVAEAYETVFCSVGTHPHNADEELDVTPEQLVELADHPKVVAIGEAGLDYYYQKSSAKGQADGFKRHIKAARMTGLPLEIHTRDAEADTIKILSDAHAEGPFPAILHCYTGGMELALKAVELGLYVSFSGVISFKKSEELRDVARALPLDRLLVETDAPYLAPVPFRGKLNEPAYVVHTARALAEARGIEFEELAEATTDNFFRLFQKVPREAAANTAVTAPAAS